MGRMGRLSRQKEALRFRLWLAVVAALIGAGAGLAALWLLPGRPVWSTLIRGVAAPAADEGAPAASDVVPAIGGAPSPVASGTDLPDPPAHLEAPTPVDPRWAPLQASLEAYLDPFGGRWAAVVVDLADGARWEYNAAERFHPASTIKMPVNLFALHEHMAGRFDWETLITYTPDDFESPGGGAFETSPFGGQYPASNLVYRSLVYSNNVAVNMLGRTLGWERIRDFTRTIGGNLYRNPDGSPAITASSAAGWWLHLLMIEREAPAKAELLLGPLREVDYDGRIAAGLPAGTPYLHKFGSYDGHFHDTGVILGARPYVLVILTEGMEEYLADEAIAGASRIVWEFLINEVV